MNNKLLTCSVNPLGRDPQLIPPTAVVNFGKYASAMGSCHWLNGVTRLRPFAMRSAS